MQLTGPLVSFPAGACGEASADDGFPEVALEVIRDSQLEVINSCGLDVGVGNLPHSSYVYDICCWGVKNIKGKI